jgi:hypothetical protein
VRAHDPEGNVVQRRPAESGSLLVGGIAYLLARAVGWEDEPEAVLAIVGIVSGTPLIVTFLVGLKR